MKNINSKVKHFFAIFFLIVILSNCDKKSELHPTANFNFDCGTCLAPCEVKFTNISQNAVSFAWDFGDGETSIEKSPKHSFKNAGKYTIKLVVKGEGGDASVAKELVLNNAIATIADFSLPNEDCYDQTELIFTNKSQNAISFLWTFGDGTESTEISPKHSYSQKGTYEVTLYVSGPGGSSSVSKAIEVKSKEDIDLTNVAVVLEYNSLWDIHTKPDKINYPNIRVQPDIWDFMRVLNDLSKIVHPETYDFVLCYTLQEVPEWKNSGPRFDQPAINIEFAHYSGTFGKRRGRNKIRSMPHMNSLGFTYPLPGTPLNYCTSLTAFHEMGHFWGVFITVQDSVGPRNWKPGYPIAWLAAGHGHWSWVFKEYNGMKMPGLMYSGPLDRAYNDFDLYLMGLMGYTEASKTVYTIYENDQPDKTHELRLDDLIAALQLGGPNFYWGDGKRIPDTDESMKHINVLIVLVKGKDEVITANHKLQLLKLKQNIESDWQEVTKNRSTISTSILRR